MPDKLTLNISKIAGTPHCMAARDGEKVYEQILAAIKAREVVQISFQGVQNLTSAFLNTAIGQLYGKLPGDDIRAHLKVDPTTSQEDMLLLKRVVERAKAYFADPERFERNFRESIGEDDE